MSASSHDRAAQAQIVLLIAAGVVAAAQIGKAIVSVPLIRPDIAAGFDHAGFLVAIFATLGAGAGIGLGAIVARLGLRSALIGGMSLIACANVAGALAPDERILFSARLIEGVGFFGVVLAIPSLLARIATPAARDVVMAVWSAYMPAGIMLMLAAGPLVAIIGWRNFWLANAALCASCCVVLVLYAPRLAAPLGATRDLVAQIKSVTRSGRCLIVASAFFAYSWQIFSLAGAGLLSALALAASTAGHLMSGLSLRFGVPIWLNLAIPFAFFALADSLIFAGDLPAPLVVALAGLALCVGGLAPGALYATAPRVAPSAAALSPTIGLVQQASNLGQFAGPLVVGLWVEHFGWQSLPAIETPAALTGLVLAFGIRIALAPDARTDRALTPVAAAAARREAAVRHHRGE